MLVLGSQVTVFFFKASMGTSIAASRRQTKSESVSPDADIARTEADIRLGETPGVREIGQMSPRVPSPLESYGP
ncbi:hypothetical protein CDAR_234121 [Caerostris darwini]|uniref:Uncharacterized protein n=1 Tax=Caerostris darwini TaxID=1538125 RepID=A0AAV4QLW0_9ARAC|nr:hypothetical protein CDAR_234121 [Caerostris darwini]